MLVVVTPIILAIAGIITNVLDLASSHAETRKSLRTSILATLIPAIIATIHDPRIAAYGALESLTGSARLLDRAALIAFPAVAYYAISALRIGFTRDHVVFNIVEFGMYVAGFYGSMFYALMHTSTMFFGFQLPVMWLMINGILYFVFIGACHALFAKYILIGNLISFVLSIVGAKQIPFIDYFIILDLLPAMPGPAGVIVIVVSTGLSAYAFAVERGWLPAHP
jgi:hypothetical protein